MPSVKGGTSPNMKSLCANTARKGSMVRLISSKRQNRNRNLVEETRRKNAMNVTIAMSHFQTRKSWQNTYINNTKMIGSWFATFVAKFTKGRGLLSIIYNVSMALKKWQHRQLRQTSVTFAQNRLQLRRSWKITITTFMVPKIILFVPSVENLSSTRNCCPITYEMCMIEQINSAQNVRKYAKTRSR